MNDRIHEWLDGELPLSALTPEERAEARRLGAVVDRVTEVADTRSPGLSARVMTSLPDTAPRRRAPFLARLRNAWPRRAVGLRAAAIAAASLLVGFGLGSWVAGDREGAGPPATADAPAADATPTVYVRFDVRIPDAESVSLAGSFSDWEPRYELTPAGEGHWTVTVPLEPGVHDYVFVVDGSRQVLDPEAPTIADGFGSFNNRIALLTSST